MTVQDVYTINQSAECPGVVLTREVAVREIDGWSQHLYVYQPAKKPASLLPALMLVHGGGFQEGDAASNFCIARYLALELGMAVFSPNYRLASPGSPTYPKPVEDIAFAWNWVRDNAAQWGVDADKVFVGGTSAGGALTAMALTKGLLPNCQGLVECWGPIDFIARWFDNGGAPGAEGVLFGSNYPLNPTLYHEASALTHVKSGLPPAVFIYGNQDPVVHKRQGELGLAAWQSVGSHAELSTFDNIGHGIVGDNTAQECQVTLRIAEFLRGLI
ncbi:alpha/beta hydrolase [Cerasicoccus maritimus]|uniref:alpha/beta hydrolase n=1 Tax=Cerasicoccus maritimus TaxID=490089 RepID=UPI0028529320|nr:alpha/beta hydrolase [Cerasicoccus maritimus]